MFEPDQLPNFFFKAFLETPLPGIVADKKKFLFANNSFSTHFGYDSDEIVQLNFDLITPENLRETAHKDYFSKKLELVHYLSERYILKKDGQVVLAEISWVRHEFESDTFIIFFIRDITTHKTKNEKQYENEKRLSLALKASKQAIWDWNNLTDETYYSDDYFMMLGYKPNEFEPSYDKWVELLHPDDVDYATYAQQLYIENKTDRYEVEFRLRKKDGTYIWTHTRALVFSRNDQGIPERVIGIVMDIDEQKKKEKAIQDLTQKLIDFAFYHSHVLRSPVANSLGLIQLIKNEKNTDYLNLLEKSISEVDDVIHKMNQTLIIETNLSIDKTLSPKISFVVSDKLSRFIFKKIITKLKSNLDVNFFNNLQSFVSSDLKEEPGHVVIVDMQVATELLEEIGNVQDYLGKIYLFLLTDQIGIADIIKAKSYPFIKGILLKPLTFEDLGSLFS